MGSPKRNFKISETTGPILLNFAEHIGPGMVFWSIKYRDCGLKFDGDRQQTKFTFLNFRKFISPTIWKIKFQIRVLNKAGVCGHLITYHIWYYCIWWWNYWITRQHSTQSVGNMPPPSPRHLLPHALQIMPRNPKYDKFQPKGHHNMVFFLMRIKIRLHLFPYHWWLMIFDIFCIGPSYINPIKWWLMECKLHDEK